LHRLSGAPQRFAASTHKVDNAYLRAIASMITRSLVKPISIIVVVVMA
jgi:hypothetical protein